jgi:hypothetical protein
MLRLTLLTVLAGLLLASPSTPVAAADEAELPTRASVSDPKHDVSKNFAPRVRRKADLDLRRVSAAWDQDADEVVLRVRVADLRKKHLKDTEDENHMWSVPSNVSAFVYFGKNLRWQVMYGLWGEPDIFAMRMDTEEDKPEPACPSEDDEFVSRFTQSADYDAETVTFRLPVDCLPGAHGKARVSGHTGWQNKKHVRMWDDCYTDYSLPEKRSPKFRFR